VEWIFIFLISSFYLRLSRAALCRPSYQGFRDYPEDVVKITDTLFARQPRERLPWLLLRNGLN
jgi:hypothetical protein